MNNNIAYKSDLFGHYFSIMFKSPTLWIKLILFKRIITWLKKVNILKIENLGLIY